MWILMAKVFLHALKSLQETTERHNTAKQTARYIGMTSFCLG